MLAHPAIARLKVQPLLLNPNILDSIDVFQCANIQNLWTFEYRSVHFCVNCSNRERLSKAVERIIQKYW